MLDLILNNMYILVINHREIVLVRVGKEIIPIPYYETPRNSIRLHQCYVTKPVILINPNLKNFSLN